METTATARRGRVMLSTDGVVNHIVAYVCSMVRLKIFVVWTGWRVVGTREGGDRIISKSRGV
jgi:hypothetical protein